MAKYLKLQYQTFHCETISFIFKILDFIAKDDHIQEKQALIYIKAYYIKRNLCKIKLLFTGCHLSQISAATTSA